MDIFNESEKDINSLIQHKTPWTITHEKILVDWADKAKCYRWLHNESHKKFKSMNTWFTIPVIIMSTITGTANFAQYQMKNTAEETYAPAVIGCVNIVTGIISTIHQFLKVAELNEGHRISSIAWDKYYRNIKVELSKHPDERINVMHMLKSCKEEFDRLMETSPIICDSIIAKFHTTFTEDKNGNYCCYKKRPLSKRELEDFERITKPEICGTLQTTDNFRHPWHKALTPRKDKIVLSIDSNKARCLSRCQSPNSKENIEIELTDVTKKDPHDLENQNDDHADEA